MSDPDPTPSPVELAMIADISCPWCYIGLRRLDRARAMRPAHQVRLRWWPFLLNPQLPPEGMDRADYMRTKFGGDLAARRVYERIGEAGDTDGIRFAFEKIKRTPNTLQAHRLVLHAQEAGAADGLIRALFRALFEEGRDIGDPEQLLDLAAACGLDRVEVLDLLAGHAHAREVVDRHVEAGRLGVRGVPVFLAQGEHAVSGAQPPEVLAGLIDVAAAAAVPGAPV